MKKKDKRPIMDLMFEIISYSNDPKKGMIVTLAMHAFNPYSTAHWCYEAFVCINPNSSKKFGRVIDPDIYKWWHEKKERQYFINRDVKNYSVEFVEGWQKFFNKLQKLSEDFHLKLWALNIDKVFPLIESSFYDAGLIQSAADLPYNPDEKFDVRTLLEVAKNLGWENKPRYFHEIYYEPDDDVEYRIDNVQSAIDFILKKDETLKRPELPKELK